MKLRWEEWCWLNMEGYATVGGIMEDFCDLEERNYSGKYETTVGWMKLKLEAFIHMFFSFLSKFVLSFCYAVSSFTVNVNKA